MLSPKLPDSTIHINPYLQNSGNFNTVFFFFFVKTFTMDGLNISYKEV